jgi:hypothetical protein
VLQVNSNPEIPIALNVGQTTDTVEVTANATAVDTRSMGVGSVVENQRILELPLNGRQPTDLIALSRAAVPTATSPAYHMQTGIQIAVAGGQTYGVGYFLSDLWCSSHRHVWARPIVDRCRRTSESPTSEPSPGGPISQRRRPAVSQPSGLRAAGSGNSWEHAA